MNNKNNYIITSGWWSCPPEQDAREALHGDDMIRGPDFHSLWANAIQAFTHPEEVLVVDSASPLKPEHRDNIKWLEMLKNFGHATNIDGRYSGYSRAIFISMIYAYFNDYTYWVYIEQDCLIYGEDIIENAIKKNPDKKIIFGSGEGTSQPIQQSFMIFHRESILDFINHYCAIGCNDYELSPEWKFYTSANWLARKLPLSIIKFLSKSTQYKYLALCKIFLFKRLSIANEFGFLGFGYGRSRPVNFSDSHFYLQHASSSEVETFKHRLKEHA